MLTIGMKGTAETVVTPDNTASVYLSGNLDVFATPAMVALMEEASWKLVQPELEEGSGTVGTKLNVEHVAASPIGNTIRCEVELTEIDRRRLVFNVICTDGGKVVGRGTHERFIIDKKKFMEKVGA